jgi:DNA polymerase-3 subunit epsilon
MRTVYLDLETTGLNSAEDEILEIGILADNGETLIDSLVRPRRHASWPEAQRIHGISPADVREAPALDDLRPGILAAVTGVRVVIYNAAFDSGFLRRELEASTEIRCAMLAFFRVFGQWSCYHNGWRWQRLHVAAAHVGFRWRGSRHRAIHYCAATRAVWRHLTEQTRGAGAPLMKA